MQKVLGEIMTMAKQQGFSVALLFVAVWWMNGKNNDLQEKIEVCNKSLIEEYKTHNSEIINLLNENAETMADFADCMDDQKRDRKKEKD